MSSANLRDTAPSSSAPTNGRSAASAQNGTAAQRYEVLERLSDEGTLWVVYRARDRASGELRALKALKSAFARHQAFAHALADSAQKVEAWRHPNLASLLEVGEEENTLFLAQEWLPGPSLEARLGRSNAPATSARGPLPTNEAIHVARQIAEALSYLAQRGEAHGDVRPRQLLAATGDARGPRWVLTDGGLSGAYASANLSILDVQSDAVLYMAPERCDGAPPSSQADCYALGVVLYRMLTGRVPFDGPSPLAIARRHRSDAPMSPANWNARLAPELEALTLRLLDKNPNVRPSASSVLELLPSTATASASPVANAVTVAPVAPIAPVPVAPAPPANVPVADDVNLDAAPGTLDAQVDEEAVKAEEKRARKRHRWREFAGMLLAIFWTGVAAAMLYGLGFSAYSYWMKSAPKEVTIPAYVGKSETDANNVLASRGLTMLVRGTRFDPKKPAGTVLSGDQPAGKHVKQGREVLVTVSRGPAPLQMVDFRELTLQRARQIIARQGLLLGSVGERYDSQIPRGYVCDQFPPSGGTIAPSEPISLVVSKGPQPPPDAPDASALPSIPGQPSVPSQTLPDPSDDSDVGTPDPDAPQATLISRSVRSQVLVPSDGQTHQVRIVVRDEDGENTVYDHAHKSGDAVNQTIRVTRRQGTQATVRVYLDDKLLNETRV